MIKKYKTVVKAEQFDGSDEMINKYDLDYEYDLEGNKRFYGSFDGFLYAGDWIVSCGGCINGIISRTRRKSNN